jgi:hypothetical protein
MIEEDLFWIDEYAGGTMEKTSERVDMLMRFCIALLDVLTTKGVLTVKEKDDIVRRTRWP